MSDVKYQVEAESKEGNRVPQELKSRDQMQRWIKLLQQNGWRVITTKAL